MSIRSPFGRRDFLAVTSAVLGTTMIAGCAGGVPPTVGALNGTLSLSGHLGEIPPPARGDPNRVLVVGAGIAGLAAANALHTAGVDVLVLEGRERVGGRLHTVTVGGVRVDAGGSWIHHAKNNCLTQVADSAGVPRRDHSIDRLMRHGALCGPRGEWLHKLETLLLLAKTVGFDVAAARAAHDVELGKSVSDVVTQYVDSAVSDLNYRRDLTFLLTRVAETVNAASTSSLGTGNYEPTYAEVGGDDVPVGGYSAITRRLAGWLPVRLGAKVQAICCDERGASVLLSNGRVERGSHVIVTVPVGVLQAGTIAFHSPWPEAKRAALRAFNPGRFEKVILRYDQRWWRERGTGFLLESARSTGLDTWLDFSEPAGAPTLVALCGGSAADALLELGSFERVVGAAADVLGSKVHPRLSTPSAWHVTNWRNDPWVRGAYASLRPGASFAVADQLAEPLWGRILFAGEATSSTLLGYADGALLSGLREAQRLLQQKYVELLI
ncbi:MAG: NAD(P)/FAD-dependent oxidoreductase [Myxococcales bacterium]